MSDVATIPVSRGKFSALVLAGDFELVSRYKWYAKPSKNGVIYAIANNQGRISGRKPISMHRLIMGLTKNDGLHVDHINHDGLDNRRGNLRLTSPSTNTHNQKDPNGVGFHKASGKWRARICVNYRSIWLGLFPTREEAVAAYESAKSNYRPTADYEAIRRERDEFYEALTACDNTFVAWQVGQIPGRPEDILALIQKVRAAIAKAEGKQEVANG